MRTNPKSLLRQGTLLLLFCSLFLLPSCKQKAEEAAADTATEVTEAVTETVAASPGGDSTATAEATEETEEGGKTIVPVPDKK
ncbi:MAG: hypothetical protein IPM95_11375 [Sphingobacteriales bacterium]|nr:hypothetical protein [Sphingobacteriales bacterium]